MKVYSQYKHEDVPSYYIKVYVHQKGIWKLFGYQCPDCGIMYKSLRIELFKHENNCKGPKYKPSLED